MSHEREKHDGFKADLVKQQERDGEYAVVETVYSRSFSPKPFLKAMLSLTIEMEIMHLTQTDVVIILFCPSCS